MTLCRYPRAIRFALISIGLAWMGSSCQFAPVSTPTVTPTPAEPQSTATAPPLVEYSPVAWFRLSYSADKWKVFDQVPETSLVIDWQYQALKHHAIEGCYLGVNTPRDFGPGVRLQDDEQDIGQQSFVVTTFYDTGNSGQLPAMVFNSDVALEYVRQDDGCIQDALDVIATYRFVQQ